MAADPWSEFEDAPTAKRRRSESAWDEFSDAKPVSRKAGHRYTPTGQAHDGDTIATREGVNARLFGYDAFELEQQGRTPSGELLQLGTQARDALLPLLPNASPTGTGAATYGRPVVTLSRDGSDPVTSLLQHGMGLASPEYLKADPIRLQDYMEAERFARQNRRGAFGTTFATPKAYRQGDGEPWADPQAAGRGGSDAVFFDEPTPFQGLRKDIAEGYLALTSDPKSTADDLMAYAKANGFSIDKGDAEAFIKRRSDPNWKTDTSAISYKDAPRVLTDPGDGRTGAVMRGVADPINFLDEIGAVADTLVPGERENVWSSDRRFGDIYANNLDQNRSILAHDDAEYPWWRFGGQLAGGVVLPGASVEGVGFAAARSALRSGASRFAAEQAATNAVAKRLGMAGAVEGGLAGAGAGEDLQARVTGTAIGAPLGTALGVGTGYLAPRVAGLIGKPFRRGVQGPDPVPSARQFADGALDTARADVENAAPRSLSTADEVISSRADFETPTLHGNVPPPPGFTIEPRPIDRIDVNAGPRPLLGDAGDLERLQAAERVNPGDVLPLPSSVVDDLDEAARINRGQVERVRAPDEAAELARRNIASPVDGTRTLPKRGPLDLVTWLRTQGGVKAQGGELEHLGIDNAPRKMDFAGGENRFGKLVSNEGMTYDDAALRAWEAGFFPDHAERPTIREFLDALDDTHTGRARRFLPEDMDEVARFEAARSQRFAVEAADDAGAPLHIDRSEPADLADLDRNSAPVSAYEEWGDNAPNLAGNIRLDKLDSPQAIKRALVRVDNVTGGFDAARRGRIAQAETESLASDLGMTARDLLARRKGQAFNAEQALAARQILAKSGTELVNMARRIQRADASDRDLALWRGAIVRHAAIQEQVAGLTAEAGRALQSFRMLADARAVNGRVLQNLLDHVGGRDSLKDAADVILEVADDPVRLNTAAKELAKPTTRQKLEEWWYNWLLSGPRTHAVNVTSNLLTSFAQLPEHAVAAGVGAVRRTMPSQAETDRVLFSELGARSLGFLQGAREGFAQMARTLRTGRTSDLESKVEAQTEEAIAGLKGKVLRFPTRLLSAEDELFKAMARRMEIGGLAVRTARAEGHRGRAVKDRVAELIANPTEDMMDRAADYGRYVTFQRPLGPAGQSIMNMTKRVPGLKLFVPFVRTPANLLKFAAERSPAAPLLAEWRKDMLAGGAKADLAVARMMVGTGAIMTTLWASAQGLVTGGGPADESARRLLEADGWQPYSIKVGDRYYSYQRLDPFSTTLGLAADFRDLQEYMTEKEQDETAKILVGATLQNLASKSWLSGMANLTEAISDPGRYGGNLVANTAGSVAVPALVAQTAQALDPLSRDAQTIMARVRSRVPGMSQGLPVRRDVLGQPISRANGGGLASFLPVYSSERRNDPTIAALLDAGVHIGRPQRRVGKHEFTAEEYDSYQELSGEALRPELRRLIKRSDWQAMDPDERQTAVARAVQQSRREAREAMGLLAKRRPSEASAQRSDQWSEFADQR
jgi:endonuclease YncB( thermonuclease family)